MQVQNVSNINFQATKVLTIKQNVLNSHSEVTEVFRLNLIEDSEFIKKCNNLFAKTRKKDLTLFERRLKSLFSDLQVKANASTEDFYIAVKNNEVITGCLNSLPFSKYITPLNLFTRNRCFDMNNALFYALLKDSQERYKGYDIKTDVLLTNTIAGKDYIESKNINLVKSKIRKAMSNVKVKSEYESNINMDDVFGTRDFETEIYPNLK